MAPIPIHARALPPGVDPAMLANPFYALAKGIHKTESIAFACVYAVAFVMYAARLLRRPKYAFVWRFLLIFCACRVAAFVVRYYVAATSPAADNFMALLIANGVMIVAGFLFLAEAVLAMLFQYWCALRGVSGEGHWKVAAARHAVIAGISVLGIAGAVLQITSVNKLDMVAFDKAKKLRQASGGLFIVVSVYAIAVPVVVSIMQWKPGNPKIINKVVPAAILSTAGFCLLLESIYRLASASKISGWITTEQAVDVLVVMPELILLAIFLAADFDSFERVSFCNPFIATSDRNDRGGDIGHYKYTDEEKAHWNGLFSDLERQQSLNALKRTLTNSTYDDMLERKNGAAGEKQGSVGQVQPSALPPATPPADYNYTTQEKAHWNSLFSDLERRQSLGALHRTRTNSSYPDMLERPRVPHDLGLERKLSKVERILGEDPGVQNSFTPLDRQASLRDLRTKRASIKYDGPGTPATPATPSTHSRSSSLHSVSLESLHSAHSRSLHTAHASFAGTDDIGVQNRFSPLERQASLRDLHTKRASVNYDTGQDLGHKRSLSDVLKATIYDPPRAPDPAHAPDDIGVQNMFTALERKRLLNDVHHKRASVNYGTGDAVAVDPGPADSPPPKNPSTGLLGNFTTIERQKSLGAIRRTRTNSRYEDMLERK